MEVKEIKKDKPRHLGKGLQALIGPIMSQNMEENSSLPISVMERNFNSDKHLSEMLREIDINAIDPNPNQPRDSWDLKELEELAASIKAKGVIQPIIVRPSGGRFEIIAGERRFRAARLADLKAIPALIRKAGDDEMLELALVENIHRTDLNPIEKAKAYQAYIDTFNLTQQQAAERLGKDRSDIANTIRLLELPEEVKQMLINGTLSMGHARAILALPTDELRKKLANRALAGRLSVRDVERLVKNYLSRAEKSSKPLPIKPPHIIDLEGKLTGALGTRVTIEARKSGHRGKIIIDFYSLDDFDRIVEKIGLPQESQV